MTGFEVGRVPQPLGYTRPQGIEARFRSGDEDGVEGKEGSRSVKGHLIVQAHSSLFKINIFILRTLFPESIPIVY